MDVFNLSVWSAVGVLQIINCARKTKVGWLEYWCCYVVLMFQLLENMF